MGDGLTPAALDSTAQGVSCGPQYCCAILTNGKVKCWGYVMFDTFGPPFFPTGRFLPWSYPLGTWGESRSVVKVAVSNSHSYVLFDDGSVQCLGFNGQGQLGVGDTIDATQTGTFEEFEQLLRPVHQGFDVDAFTGALDVTVSIDRTCILRRDRRIVCFGYNANGELGVGDILPYGTEPGNSGVNLKTVDLGTDPETQEPYLVKSFGLGNCFACALLMEGSVKCWSSDGTSAAGGDSDAVAGATPESMGDDLPFVDYGDEENNNKGAVAIAVGYANVCLTRKDCSVVCWGWEVTGILGRDEGFDAGGSPGAMGAALVPINFGDDFVLGGCVAAEPTPTEAPTVATETPTVATETPTVATETPTVATETPTVATTTPSMEATTTPSVATTTTPTAAIIGKCRVPEKQLATKLKPCNVLIKRSQTDPQCQAYPSKVINIGYGAICIQYCASRAHLLCSNEMKRVLKVDSFSCYQTKNARAKKLIKQLLKQGCKKHPLWFRDGGCKNSDGVGRHGCEWLFCPMQCAKMSACAWSTRNGLLTKEQIHATHNNPTHFYEGSCVRV